MSTVRTGRHRRGRRAFIADQRGTAALEMPIIFLFLMISLFLPLADLAIAGFRFISAHQALRDMGQRTQYSPPGDVTNSSVVATWKGTLPTSISGFTITTQVYCGTPGTACSAGSGTAATMKYYTFSTTFPLSPMVLGSALCSTCTISYTQRFQ
jgi:Flp pilus assembly protein TadG